MKANRARVSVSVSFVEKLLHRQRTHGSLAALPWRGGPVPCLDAPARTRLVAGLRQQPGATVNELRVWPAALGGRAVSRTRLGRAVQALGWDGRCRRWAGGKKKCVHAAERNTERVVALRSALVEAVQRADFTCCKFVDETSTNLIYCRRYARAEGGQRACQARACSQFSHKVMARSWTRAA